MMNDADLQQLLLNQNLLTQEQLDKALEEMKRLKRPLEAIVVDLRFIDRATLYHAIARQQGFNYMPLDTITADEQIPKLLPEALSYKTESVPIKLEGNTLHVAMADPADLGAIDQIQLQTGMLLELYIASPAEIEEARATVYSKNVVRENLLTDIAEAKPEQKMNFGDGSNIIKVVDLVMTQAVRDRASDIHVEPEQDTLRIRFRIDGILHEIPSPPKDWEAAIISRIKVLSGMDIAESRIPQDGHFQSKVDEKIIDFRVSTVPTIYGENLVIRLLDTASVMIGLEKLGFTTNDDLKAYEGLISRPYGIILSTGPTGSGKTTTLYSALMRINTIDRNIITIEDPVEYRLGLIRQIQVNPRAGITFANGLRAILRQDPDVIMLGEIRDLETAVTAIQSALTGHLVFSTLHTNDAPSSITRLINMGVEPFLISASLIGVMAQRLVRMICEHCKEQYEPTPAVIKKWGLSNKKGVVFSRGKGCEFCKGTGFRGRTGLYELLVCDDEIREMIINGSSHTQLRKKAQEKGMRLLSEDGLTKALAGITTLEEVARVCEEHIELKPSSQVLELQPAAPGVTVTKKPGVAGKVVVKPTDMDDYQRKIANWLGNKK
ncbi:MAG TPA: GspE/PulE family protein [Candidatus Omnitrophota bacterium]|nr:GspE/PulE family protein [Candidatus Omnitrophota bacterium]HQO37193.1 GspE/PulE family protein [Candidatus Omnitrophota bacterium]HQQ05412.1 GspE/PulE family protein [Candidatus Omnitrophota bacterium]